MNRLKQFRRVATRDEKRATNLHAIVTLAALLIGYRTADLSGVHEGGAAMPKWRSGALAQEPLANEWLYSCPSGLSTPQIAAALGASDHPFTEVSARLWQQDWQMANTFIEAYAYPKSYWLQP